MVKAAANYVRRKMGASDWFAPVLVYSVLGAIVLGPALRYGFVFLLDMPWPEKFQLTDFTSGNTAHVPLSVALTVLNKIFPAWVLQKVFLIGIFVCAGFTMYRLQRHMRVPRSRRYAAGLLYAYNPFVLERLASGQWLVLAGYALLPLFVARLIKFVREPNQRHAVKLGLLYAAYPIFSVHWWYIITLFTAPVGIWWLYARFKKYPKKRGQLASHLVLAAAAVLAINIRWIWSVLSGASKLGDISAADFRAFATAGEGWFGAIGNVLSLYGFWQQPYDIPGEVGLVSWMLPLLYILLAGAGAWRFYRKYGRLALAPLVVLPVAVILAAGFGSPLTMPLTSVFIRIVPGYAGMRDTAKLVGIIAFIYAFYLPSGLAVLGVELRKIRHGLGNRKLVAAGFIGMYMVMMAGGLWGISNQLKAYPYPNGWAEAETYLHVQGARRIVVLPWRGAMPLNFANDTYATNPAGLYFTADVVQGLSGNMLTLDGHRNEPAFDVLASDILQGSVSDAMAAYKQRGVEYVVLLKTADWEQYAARLESLTPEYDNADVAVYKL